MRHFYHIALGALCTGALLMTVSCTKDGVRPTTAPTSSTDGAADNPFRLAQWDFETRDSAGSPLTRGVLTLPTPIKPGEQFFGSWQSRFVGKPEARDQIGPQLNGGKLAGTLRPEDGQLVLELNPENNDNNVNFTGTLDPAHAKLTGRWEYANFTGVANRGTFEATKQK